MSGENLAPARTAWIAHLETCTQCNYDRECMECVAGDGTGEHACNCKKGGEGYALAKAVEVERAKNALCKRCNGTRLADWGKDYRGLCPACAPIEKLTTASLKRIPQADEAAFLRNEVRELRKTLAVAEKALEFAEPIAAQLVRSEPGKGGEKLHSWHLVVGAEAATLTRTHINSAVTALLQIREALREPVSR